MEIARNEIEAVQEVTKNVPEKASAELNELQLALVGGGFGDPVFG